MWEDSCNIITSRGAGYLEGNERVKQSHQRCAKAQVPRNIRAPRQSLQGDTLRQFLVCHSDVTAYIRLLFSEIIRRLSDARTMLVLTDSEAYIVETHSHPAIVDRLAYRFNIRAGVSLSEQSCGTNAVALAIYDRQEAVVRGEQHYCQLFFDCCSVAAPVFNLDGEIAGSLCLLTFQSGELGDKAAIAYCLTNELQTFLRTGSIRDETQGKKTYAHRLLTTRQREVLALFAQGLSYKQIAQRLGMRSTKTVEEHLDAARAKLGATTRRQCIQRAAETGVLGFPRPPDNSVKTSTTSSPRK